MYSCRIWIITLYSVLPLGVVGYGNLFNNKPLRFFESLFLFVFYDSFIEHVNYTHCFLNKTLILFLFIQTAVW